MSKIEKFFYVKRGKGGYLDSYTDGTIPLISATNQDNGVYRLVNGKPNFRAPAITVERVSGSAFVQLVDFSTVPDDVHVLIPKIDMSIDKLYLVASIINNSRWRFSYSRKLSSTRLKKFPIPDLNSWNLNLHSTVSEFMQLYRTKTRNKTQIQRINLAPIPIAEFFSLHSGDFHSTSELSEGKVPLVSCGDINNGIINNFAIPPDCTFRNMLTIAYNGQPLTTKFHPYSFGAKDDVAVCLPKRDFKLSTLIYFQYVLNKEKWRYSYGRKCFREKLSKMKLHVPVDSNGALDENVIESMLEGIPYWDTLKELIRSYGTPTLYSFEDKPTY
jgi:hypothetical protein